MAWLGPITAWGIMVWHIRSHTRCWEAGTRVRCVDVPSFQTLTNAEGKSTLESLVLECGGTTKHFITLSINLLQTLGSSEEKARSVAAWRWACYRKRFRFAGREVWKMPVGCLSALSLALTSCVKSWDANPQVSLYELDAPQPFGERGFSAGFFLHSEEWGESVEPPHLENPTLSKNNSYRSQKTPKPNYLWISPLGGLRISKKWWEAAIARFGL